MQKVIGLATEIVLDGMSQRFHVIQPAGDAQLKQKGDNAAQQLI